MSNADIRGRFIWHELMTTDTDAAGAFYSKVVPWKTQASGMPGYTLWHTGKTQAGGLMALPQQSQAAGAPPQWLLYIGTPSVDAAVQDVQRLGGKILKGAADIPNVGRFAVVSDPQGAAFALYTPAAASAEGAASSAQPGDFPWHELSTTDLNAAVSFYVAMFGWEKGPAHDMGPEMGIYQLITRGGQQIAGMFKAPGAAMPPNWLTYVQVADIDKAAQSIKAAGGRVMNGPHQVPGGTWIVQAMDPQGGTFAVLEPASMAAPAQPAKPAAAPKPAAPKPAPAATAPPPPKPVTAATPPKAAAPSVPPKAPAPAAAKPAAVKKVARKATKKVAKKAAKKGVRKAARKPAKPAKPKAKMKAKAARKKSAGKRAAPRSQTKRKAKARKHR